MRSRTRRAVTSFVLLVAALTIGCGNESTQSLLPGNNVSLLPAVNDSLTLDAEFSPIVSTTSAQVLGSGTTDDVATANQTADGVTAALSSGGVGVAALGQGDSISDPGSSPMVMAMVSTSSSRLLGSDATIAASTRRALTTSQNETGLTTGPFRYVDGRLYIQDGTTDLTIDGVVVTTESTGPDLPPEVTVTLSNHVRAFGTVPGGDDGTMGVDLHLRGVTGSLTILGENQTPRLNLELTSAGVRLSGHFGPADGDIEVSGVVGTVHEPQDLARLLAQSILDVNLRTLSVDRMIQGATARVSFDRIGISLDGGDAPLTCAGIFGSAAVNLHPDVNLTSDGRIAIVRANVDRSTPIVFDGSTNGPPSSGILTATLVYRGGRNNMVTVNFAGGRQEVSGQVTNSSGEIERVETAGDTRKAIGTARLADGRKTEHEVAVTRGPEGKQIRFTVLVKMPDGSQQLRLTGRATPDRGVTGNWDRFSPPGTGLFHITPAGLLEVRDGSGSGLAKVTLAASWNKNF